MPTPQGHDSGQPDGAVAAGFTWGHYVESFVSTHGSWIALADELLLRASRVIEEPPDLQSIEKGLRRLSARGSRPGGQYGRWMIRFFGVPSRVADLARWLGQYHSRFSDLPVPIQREQLGLWNRPPLSETAAAAWIEVGLAACAKRTGDDVAMRESLARATRLAPKAGPDAEIETALFTALIASLDGRRAEVAPLLDRASDVLAAAKLEASEAASYAARIADQRAYQHLHPRDDPRNDIAAARELYERIDASSGSPFVAFRRHHGLAYCEWRLGDTKAAIEHANRAKTAAGDAGQVRFRVMALNLLCRLLPPSEATALRERADAMARALEDDDLRLRLHQPGPRAEPSGSPLGAGVSTPRALD